LRASSPGLKFAQSAADQESAGKLMHSEAFMQNPNPFGEDQKTEAGADENSVIVESWLDFVAARGDYNNFSSPKTLNAEIKDRIQELCVRIDAMLEERKLFFAELERMTQSDPAAEVSNNIPLNLPPAKPQAVPGVDAKSESAFSSTHPPESERLSSARKIATRIRQAFKRSPKTRTYLV